MKYILKTHMKMNKNPTYEHDKYKLFYFFEN